MFVVCYREVKNFMVKLYRSKNQYIKSKNYASLRFSNLRVKFVSQNTCINRHTFTIIHCLVRSQKIKVGNMGSVPKSQGYGNDYM